MSPDEYVLSIKEKFGDKVSRDGVPIRDMNDRDLLKKMITRYPGDRQKIVGLEEYLSVDEIPPDAPKTEVERQLYDRLIDNPITRGIQDFFPGKKIGQALVQTGVNIGHLAKGDIKGFQEEVRQNPINVPELAGDVVAAGATAFGAGMAPAKALLPKVAQSAGIGATIGGANELADGGSVEEVAKDAALGGAIGGAIPLAGEALKGMGRLFQGAGDKIQLSVIKPSQADYKDGFKLETLKKYGLGGSLKSSFEKTENVMDDLQKQLNDRLGNGNPVRLIDVLDDTQKELLGASKVKSFGSNTSIEGAIKQLGDEISAVVDDVGEVPLKDAQMVKRAAGHLGAWQFGARDPDSTAREKVYNVFYTKLKEAIEKSSPEGVKEINKEMGDLIPVMNALIRRIPVADRNNILSLSDIVALTGSAFEPRTLGVYIMNLMSKSGTFGNMLSKTGEQVQKGLPQVTGNAARVLGPTALPD